MKSSKKVLPIKPEEIIQVKEIPISSEFIEIFNKLIKINYKNGKSVINQRQVLDGIRKSTISKLSKSNKVDIFNVSFLSSVKTIFENVGWIVQFKNIVVSGDYHFEISFSTKNRKDKKV